MKPLIELLVKACLLVDGINQHPDYQLLLKKGYQPDLNISDAHTALVYLMNEIQEEE